MRLGRVCVIILILLAVCAPFVHAREVATTEPVIRVGLLLRQSQLKLSADTAFFLLSGDGHSVKAFAANESVVISVKSGHLLINGTPAVASALRVGFAINASRGHGNGIEQLLSEAVNVNDKGSSAMLNGSRYRGIIEVRQEANSLVAINVLPLEKYLYGVVPKEISPSWHLEAIKAQAVAARSYAFASAGKHQGQGFEVCTTVHCQVYGGRDAEAKRSNQAVDETSGMMATYGGKVITAFFHSSSGGHTEHSENVWGSPYPYLRGVPDSDQQSPRFKWEQRVSATALVNVLSASGSKIGQLIAIELSPLARQPVVATDRGVSGRVKTVRFFGTGGTIALSGAKFSSMLGLPSSLFDIASVGIDRTVYAPDKRPVRRPVGPQDVLVITGWGAGHGIGLSQWGAKAMAERSAGSNKQYFKEILGHYYTGTIVRNWY